MKTTTWEANRKQESKMINAFIAYYEGQKTNKKARYVYRSKANNVERAIQKSESIGSFAPWRKSYINVVRIVKVIIKHKSIDADKVNYYVSGKAGAPSRQMVYLLLTKLVSEGILKKTLELHPITGHMRAHYSVKN